MFAKKRHGLMTLGFDLLLNAKIETRAITTATTPTIPPTVTKFNEKLA
jgi:hypothetical protein